MNLYVVKLAPEMAGNTVNGVNAHVVYAEDDTDALEMVKSYYSSNKTVWDSADVEEISFADALQPIDMEGWKLGIVIHDGADELLKVEAEGAEGIFLYDFTISDGGADYTIGDTVSVAGGTGTALSAEVTSVSDGAITAVTVLNVGDYTVGPTSPNTLSGGTGTGAIGEFIVGEGVSIHQLAAAVVTGLNATDEIAGAEYDPTTGELIVAAASDSLGDHTVDAYLIPPYVGAIHLSDVVSTITDGGSASAALEVVLLGPDDYKAPVVHDTFGNAV